MRVVWLLTYHISSRKSIDGGSSPMSSEATFVSRTNNDFDGDYKRKQPENGDHNEQQQRHHPNKSSRNGSDVSPNNRNGSDKKQQNHKLNWNLLKPPKPQNKRS
ncbi:hypothetical protein Scep_005385 [Stephania cephalantha]|uniref:Uncharacterized protein n=1 Tax=Stephania cephalantha TaxID=152367 RepID=A0AAP0KU73_9MAGN